METLKKSLKAAPKALLNDINESVGVLQQRVNKLDLSYLDDSNIVVAKGSSRQLPSHHHQHSCSWYEEGARTSEDTKLKRRDSWTSDTSTSSDTTSILSISTTNDSDEQHIESSAHKLSEHNMARQNIGNSDDHGSEPTFSFHTSPLETIFCSTSYFDYDKVDQAREEIKGNAERHRRRLQMYKEMRRRAAGTRLQKSRKIEMDLEDALMASLQHERELEATTTERNSYMRRQKNALLERNRELEESKNELQQLQAKFDSNAAKIEQLSEERNRVATMSLELDILVAYSGLVDEDSDQVLEHMVRYKIMNKKLRNHLGLAEDEPIELGDGKAKEEGKQKDKETEHTVARSKQTSEEESTVLIHELSKQLMILEGEKALAEDMVIELEQDVKKLSQMKSGQELRIQELERKILEKHSGTAEKYSTPKA